MMNGVELLDNMEMMGKNREFTSRQLEVQERMKENGKIIENGSSVQDFPNKTACLEIARKEHELYGMSDQFHKVLEKGGISYQEYQDYFAEKMIAKADAEIQATRKVLGGDSLATRIHEENMEKALGTKTVSFGGAKWDRDLAESKVISAVDRHLKEGNNSVAVKNRIRDLQELEKKQKQAEQHKKMEQQRQKEQQKK